MHRLSLLLLLSIACSSEEAPGEVPVNDADLTAWVEEGAYLDWVAEAEVHASAGPHFGDVRTFVNDDLAASLADGESPHPAASAAVKELYGDGDQVAGWAVMVKLEKGEGGDTWYWWERYEDDTLIDGRGEDPCVSCHAAGTDHVLSDPAGLTGGDGQES